MSAVSSCSRTRRAFPRLALLASCTIAPALAVASCDGQSANAGLGEPIQVAGGQFMSGRLPGSVPTNGVPAGAPRTVTNLSFSSGRVLAGGIQSVSGRTSADAVAVGVALADLGTGYWVVPVGPSDPLFPGEVTFGFSASFNADDPPGMHLVRSVAIDASGKAGAQLDTPLCFGSRVPDNFHACDPSSVPPAAVISLRWDADFDLDLHVVTPSGVDINPKMPLGLPLEGGVTPSSRTPRIDRDSLRQCVPDGVRQEDLVFPTRPPAGLYKIVVDPFDSCGQAAVRFKLTVFEVAGACPACQLTATSTQGGELLQSQVTGGGSSGLFVAEYPLGAH